MKKEWTFRPDQMAESLSEVDAFVENTTMERRYRIKLSLLIEELVLIYRDALGDDTVFSIRMKDKYGDLFVDISAEGEALDPLKEPTPILRGVFHNSFDRPVWSYSNGRNNVQIIVPMYNTFPKNIRMSWKYMKGQRRSFVLAVVSQLVSVGLKIAAPLLTAEVIICQKQR